jgi:hypothetical protein
MAVISRPYRCWYATQTTHGWPESPHPGFTPGHRPLFLRFGSVSESNGALHQGHSSVFSTQTPDEWSVSPRSGSGRGHLTLFTSLCKHCLIPMTTVAEIVQTDRGVHSRDPLGSSNTSAPRKTLPRIALLFAGSREFAPRRQQPGDAVSRRTSAHKYPRVHHRNTSFLFISIILYSPPLLSTLGVFS